ncbi:MAG: SIMPL domain-containing protein [Pikeienuella sp.]
MKKLLTAAIGSILFATAAFAEPTLSMTGEGRVGVAPDVALVRIGVQTRAEEATTALNRNSASANALIMAARNGGVEARDIQTSGLSLQPFYVNGRDGGEAKLAGFSVSNEVAVRVRKVDALGEILGALVGAGANMINGIEFGVADMGAAMDETRRAAVADARRKAELYAEAAGVTLGPIISIAEWGGGSQGMMGAMAAQSVYEMAPVPVEAGEMTLFTNVSVVWSIKGAE